jgi:hypothetical protein
MKKQKVHTYRSETLPPLSLKLVLTDARKDLPSRVSKKDRNEELALKLIERMKMNSRLCRQIDN